MRRLFLDLDGVLADFDAWHDRIVGYKPNKDTRPANWQRVAIYAGFYASMPPKEDCFELWDYAKQFNPTILTGLPRSIPNAENDKRNWVREYLGADVPVICTFSREKWKSIERVGDVLVDDWHKHRDAWELRGGIWITHTDARSSIAKLKLVGF